MATSLILNAIVGDNISINFLETLLLQNDWTYLIISLLKNIDDPFESNILPTGTYLIANLSELPSKVHVKDSLKYKCLLLKFALLLFFNSLPLLLQSRTYSKFPYHFLYFPPLLYGTHFIFRFIVSSPFFKCWENLLFSISNHNLRYFSLFPVSIPFFTSLIFPNAVEFSNMLIILLLIQ